MRVLGGIIGGFLLLFQCQGWAQPSVKVRLKERVESIHVSGWRLHFQAVKSQSLSAPEGGSFSIRLVQTKPWKRWQLRNRDKSTVHELRGETLSIRGTSVLVNSHPFPDKIILSENGHKHFDVVGSLELEDYLAGVLPAEMPAAWPREALKAQAVASRSYTLAIIKERKGQSFHLEASVMDQVFDLKKLKQAPSHYSRKISKVLTETQGWVLTQPNNHKIFKSHYHSDCGGHTEQPHQVWQNGDHAASVKDPYCPQSPSGQWQKSFTRWEIQQKLEDSLALLSPGQLLGLRVVGRTPSGRAKAIQAIFSKHPAYSMGANEFREVMGYKNLKSTQFKLKQKGSKFILSGRGYGHGVGLCQWGTRHWAQRGKKAPFILQHYYPTASLKRVSL